MMMKSKGYRKGGTKSEGEREASLKRRQSVSNAIKTIKTINTTTRPTHWNDNQDMSDETHFNSSMCLFSISPADIPRSEITARNRLTPYATNG